MNDNNISPELISLIKRNSTGKALEIAMTGRKVTAKEAYQIGLCEKIVDTGSTRQEAEAMAHEIARFPQAAVLADRRSCL